MVRVTVEDAKFMLKDNANFSPILDELNEVSEEYQQQEVMLEIVFCDTPTCSDRERIEKYLADGRAIKLSKEEQEEVMRYQCGSTCKEADATDAADTTDAATELSKEEQEDLSCQCQYESTCINCV